MVFLSVRENRETKFCITEFTKKSESYKVKRESHWIFALPCRFCATMKESSGFRFPLSVTVRHKVPRLCASPCFSMKNPDNTQKGYAMSDIEKDVEEILVDENAIREIVDRLAAQITKDYRNSPRKLLILSILKGSMPFTADLIRHIPLPLEIDFMKVSSYGAGTVSSGQLKITLDLNREDIRDLDIIIVEDIIDSGNTLFKLKKHLAERGAYSVKICTLLDKPSRREVPLNADYCGAEIPDKFVIGYGLDYDEKYRNLPYVGVLKKKVYSHN